MIIGFKPQFVQPILEGTKIHTVREDKRNRWERNLVMHMATGVRTNKYKEFAQKICTGVQLVEIWPQSKSILVQIIEKNGFYRTRQLSTKEVEQFIKNDGFEYSYQFWEWFNEPFKGKIIHWTSFKY